MTGRITKTEMDRELFALLRDWCGALPALQIRDPDPALDGGIRCPACGGVHGRCHEAVYPLLTMAARTGEERYLDAARRLFRWGGNLLRPDGAVVNDRTSDWKGVTAFAAIALHDALFYHGGLLTETERAAWEARLAGMGGWLYRNLRVGFPAYINYYAAGAGALALLGAYFDRADYRAAADALAAHCFAHVSENGLLYGECSPQDARSPKGCLGIDIGYNAEESLPALCRYAQVAGGAARDACAAMAGALLDWMLPDGAWDDSAGTRSFKWTYWGSRTADGCTDALLWLGKKAPVYAEAALRNLTLLKKCTHAGLLAGGPDYAAQGEKICVHHTFCHAKSLAAALDAGVRGFDRRALPADDPPGLRYFPETDGYRLANGGWLAAVTGYDARYKQGGHISGGALSLLWHRDAGPLVAAGMASYALLEPQNQQTPADPATHACPCPRLETTDGQYAQHFDPAAKLQKEERPGGPAVRAAATLCVISGARPGTDAGCSILYTLEKDGLLIEGEVCPALTGRVRLVLPVTPAGGVTVYRGSLPRPPARRFCLTPGFIFNEYAVLPDAAGGFAVRITLRDQSVSSQK